MSDEKISLELATLLTAGDELDARAALMALPSGIHESIAPNVYHARVPGIASKSTLDLIARSPAHYRAWVNGADSEPTPAMSLGTAVHLAVLEPEQFAKTYVIAPHFGDGRTKDAKAAKADWLAAHAGAVVLDARDGALTLGMVKAIAAHPTASALLIDGRPEVTVKWKDEATGLYCKARADFWLPDILTVADLKTTQDAREPSFSKSIENYGYYRQCAHYTDGFYALGQEVDFVFIAVESSPPHNVAVYQLDAEDVRAGRDEIAAAMRMLAECLENDTWPGYATGVQRISRPAWARRKTS